MILALLCCMPVFVNAQADKGSVMDCKIKGVLQDSLSRSGEEYATGRVYKKSSPEKMEKAFVTQGGGKFEFRMNQPGEYVLRLSSVGKREAVAEFAVKSSDKSLDLGTYYVAEADNVMGEVVVSALKPLVKMDVDKMEYDVEQDPDSKTDNVIEMLRKVPLVSIDAEENIEVNGSAKFKIHVNGKPNSLMSNNPKDVLRSMPASSIKKIEVITNPGARYDAEGVTGILNIVTMGTKMQGHTISVNAGVSNTGVNAGTYATIQRGKFTTSVRYNYNHYDPRPGDGESERIAFESVDNYDLKSRRSYQQTNNSHNGGVEASYEFDTLRLLTLSGDFYIGNGHNEPYSSTEMLNNRGGRTYFYNTVGTNKYTYAWGGGSLDYQRTFKRNKEELFTFSYRFNGGTQTGDNQNEFTNVESTMPIDQTIISSLTNMRSDSWTSTQEHSFQADYTNPITKMHQIETGVKYVFRPNDSDGDYYSAPLGSEEYQIDSAKSSKYAYNQSVLGVYFSYRLKWKDFSAKLGARYEHTFQDVKYYVGDHSNFDAGFDDVVPSALFSYKLSETSNIRLGYNMRISRPGIWTLDPYVDRETPGSLYYGNPDLDTEKSHSFNLSYGRATQKYSLNVSGFYSFVNNSIQRYSFLQNDTMHTTYGNVGKSVNAGMSLYINWKLTTSTRVYCNANLSYSDYRSDEMDLTNHGYRLNGNGGIQQNLPWGLNLGVNGGGSTPNITLQGKGSGYYYYGASLNKELLNKKLNISLRANNFFNKYQTYSSYTETAEFRQTYNNRNYRMNYGINISYRFGELKASVKKAQRSIENDDVKGGGAQGGGSE